MKSANYPKHVKVNSQILTEFLGQSSVVLVLDDVDCVSAKNQHKEWFARLQAATRNSSAMVHAFQTKIGEGGKSFLGDASTAAALTQQWELTDEALIAEERLLIDNTALQMVRESVKCAVEAADELLTYLTRSKEDWLQAQMDSFQNLSEHLSIFPDLGRNEFFLDRLTEVCGLPVVDEAAALRTDGPSHTVEIEEANLPVFRRLFLFQNAHKMYGNAIPLFLALDGKVCARYIYEGMLDVNDFSKKYEMTAEYLNSIFASASAAAEAFQRHVGRQHGGARPENIFVDVLAGRVILGAPSPPPTDKSDVRMLAETMTQLAVALGLELKPGKPLFKPTM